MGSKAITTVIGRSIGKFFRHPVGKATGFVATAVGGVVAERVAERAGYVDKVSDFTVGALDYVGLTAKKKLPESPVSPPVAETKAPSANVGGAPGAQSPFTVGHGGPGCGCNKKGHDPSKPPCSGCSKTTATNFVAGVKGLPEYAAVVEAAKTNPEVAKVLADVGFGTDPNWHDDPCAYKVDLNDGQGTRCFKSKAAFDKWQHAQIVAKQKADQQKQQAAQRALEAQKKSYQNRIAALQRQLEQQADAAAKKATADQIAALQAQLAAAQAVPPMSQLPVTASQQVLATAANAPQSMADMIQQLMQFKMLESALQQPSQPQQLPWGGPSEVIVDPGSGQPVMIDPASGQGYPMDPGTPAELSSDDEYQQWADYSVSGSQEGPTDEEMIARFDTQGVAEDYEAIQAINEETSIEGDGGEVSALMNPGAQGDMDLGGEGYPEVVLDEEMDCESCQAIY